MSEQVSEGNEGPSKLIEAARRVYEQYKIDELPVPLQRNSLDYYYLSVYPGLQEMRDINTYPEYPKEVTTMYIHTPFCSGICNFCSYFVKSTHGDTAKIEDYYELLKKEVDHHATKTQLKLKYLYFGGGTPSLIPPDTLDSFLSYLDAKGALNKPLFGTFELHPEFFEDLDSAQRFIDVIKKYGISRISIGYESSSEKVLSDTNRRHKKDFLRSAVEFIRKNGLSFNIDLMYGMPNLSLEDWERTLRDAIEVNPDSITPYFLFVDKRTGMYKNVQNGVVKLPSHKDIQTQHVMAQMFLEQNGFFELPNDFFARIDGDLDPSVFEQTTLPSQLASLPIGAGSYGYMSRTQFYTHFDLNRYKKAVSEDGPFIWRGVEMDDETLMRRDIMFLFKNGLQIVRKLFVDRYGKDIVKEFGPVLDKLVELDLIILNDATVSLTRKGRLVVEEIACQFKDSRVTVQTNIPARDVTLLERHNYSPTYPKLDTVF